MFVASEALSVCWLLFLVQEPYAPLPPAQWILPLHTCRSGLPSLFRSIPGALLTRYTRFDAPVGSRSEVVVGGRLSFWRCVTSARVVFKEGVFQFLLFVWLFSFSFLLKESINPKPCCVVPFSFRWTRNCFGKWPLTVVQTFPLALTVSKR